MRSHGEMRDLAKTDPRLSDNDYRVFVEVSERIESGKNLIPRRSLREACRISTSTITRSVRFLKSCGYLYSHYRGYLSSAYSYGYLATHPSYGSLTHSSVETAREEPSGLSEQFVDGKIVYLGTSPPPLAFYDDRIEQLEEARKRGRLRKRA